MDEFMKQLLYFVASYGGLIVVLFFSLNWVSKGWLTTFLKVKSSRGKKILVIVDGVADTYFRVGTFEDHNRFRFKDRNGQYFSLTDVRSEDIKHIMGVSTIQFDMVSHNIVRKGECKPSASPEAVDDLVTMILQAPQVSGNNFQLFVLIMLGLSLLLVGVAVYFGYANQEAIEGLKLAGMIV
jgi:hypothetical protein